MAGPQFLMNGGWPGEAGDSYYLAAGTMPLAVTLAACSAKNMLYPAESETEICARALSACRVMHGDEICDKIPGLILTDDDRFWLAEV